MTKCGASSRPRMRRWSDIFDHRELTRVSIEDPDEIVWSESLLHFFSYGDDRNSLFDLTGDAADPPVREWEDGMLYTRGQPVTFWDWFDDNRDLFLKYTDDGVAQTWTACTQGSMARVEERQVMRDVVLYMSMSLDGFVESDREHPGMAIPEGAELKQWKLDRISKAGAHLMGRVTYQQMSSYWPQSDDPYAAPMNDIPKVVFSKTLSDAEATWPDTRVARGDLATEIAAIKAQPGRDVIVWGGGTFAGALAAANLIDEYRLLVQPVVLGRGRGLFDQVPESRHLNLIEALSFPSGIVVHIYRPQHT
jgi:dihydrofolate reductase